MTALQILRAAYETGVAPPHLRGRTQGKTMGARLSEDILHFRDASRFYRTSPGRFFLRNLMDASEIPEDLRRPIVARRRRRVLIRDQALAFRREAILACSATPLTEISERVLTRGMVLRMIQHGEFHYTPPRSPRSKCDVMVWSFVLVIRGGAVLTYRQGPYREDRDTFMRRRTIGFYAPVLAGDRDLFDQADHGIVSSGVRALAMDLDLLDGHLWDTLSRGTELRSFVVADAGTAGAGGDFATAADLLAVVIFDCPEWLDPTTKRLAINDLEWLDLRAPLNHVEDFDPWSRAILSASKDLALSTTVR